MKKLFYLFLTAVMLAGCLTGCKSVKKASTPGVSSQINTADDTPADNTSKPFLGKWETYKAYVNDQYYETEYVGYPMPALMKIEVFDDKNAEITTALNPHHKDVTESYKWYITTENGCDTLHIVSPDDRYACLIEQGQMTVRYADYDDGTIIYLNKVSEFTPSAPEKDKEAENADFSSYMGRWQSEEITIDGETYTDKVGEYPVEVSFRMELFEDNTCVMNIFGDPVTYEWDTETKDNLYMWTTYEGFVIKKEGSNLIIDNENGIIVKFHKVSEFTDYDFTAAADSAPDEDIILYPEPQEEENAGEE